MSVAADYNLVEENYQLLRQRYVKIDIINKNNTY